MKTYGNAVAGGIYGDTPVDLPHADTGARTTHRPWCCDCKRTLDADQLDDTGRCDRCIRIAANRAAAAVRRAEQQAAEAARPKPKPAPKAPRRRAAAPRARKPAAPRAPREPKPRPGPMLGPSVPIRVRRAAADRLDVQRIILEYRAGETTPTIAERHGVTPKRIYALLDHHGIERRDDRANYSGSKPKQYDPALVAQVAELYGMGMSRTEVADSLGLTRKIVETIMGRHNIPARQNQAGRQDGARGLKDQIAALGVSVREIKTWALEHGLIDDATKPGIPSAHIVEAYAEERG